jgi:hypothetical protein
LADGVLGVLQLCVQEVIAEVEAAQAAADRAAAAARDDDAADGLEQQQEEEQHEQEQQHQEQQEHQAAAAAAVAAATPRQLWVDKYAPKSFLALLSEPRINREIAAWMSRWNKQQQQHQQHRSNHQQPHKQQLPQPPQQQGGRGGAGRGRGAGGPAAAGGRGGGRGSSGRGEGGSARQGGILRGFDAARYKALQEARAAARVLLVVGPPGGCAGQGNINQGLMLLGSLHLQDMLHLTHPDLCPHTAHTMLCLTHTYGDMIVQTTAAVTEL